ncbi:MAG: dTMP kinase, partial [Victivallales bacterium]|nr:dTMP kinase [Victivallales bacterium]
VIAERLRVLVKHHHDGELLTDEAELLLIAAGRAQHVRNLILPALAAGRIVLCDRFFDSTTAYQGYARGIDLKFIADLNRFAACGCLPDLTLLLDLPPEEGFRRTAERVPGAGGADRIEDAGIAFHRRVYDGYRRIAAAAPERIRTVPAAGEPAAVSHQIERIVADAIRGL